MIQMDSIAARGGVAGIKRLAGEEPGVHRAHFVPLDLDEPGRVIEGGVGVVGDRGKRSPHTHRPGPPARVLKSGASRRRGGKEQKGDQSEVGKLSHPKYIVS